MLLTLRALSGSKWCNAIDKFLHSPYYIALVSALAACANIFGGELPVWYIFAVLVIVIVLFAEDALPVVPMFGCGYISVSAANNPAGHFGTSLFQDRRAIVQLAVIASFIAAALIARLVFDLVRPRSAAGVRRMPRLTAGFVLLGAAYLVAGALVGGEYAPQWKSSLFGLVQILCLAAPYLYFRYTVNWSKTPRVYLAQCFVGLGSAIVAEIVAMYVFAFASLAPGASFSRGLLNTGWGVYNNVGFLLAFCIPFAFDLALRCRHGNVYLLVAHLFELALVFTQSRGSILCGTVIYIACFVFTLLYLNRRQRWTALIGFGSFVVVVVIAGAVFRDKVAEIFASLKKAGLDDSNRFKLYLDGLQKFAQSAQSVLLGNGFYSGGYRYGNDKLPSDAFLPPRYHNTVVQLLASGGLITMVAYLFHRFQTLKLCLTHRTFEKIFILAAILVLISASMVDCHFFNMGPGLIYSIVLVFAENMAYDDTLPKLTGRRKAEKNAQRNATE